MEADLWEQKCQKSPGKLDKPTDTNPLLEFKFTLDLFFLYSEAFVLFIDNDLSL